MELSEENRHTLLLSVHQLIEEQAGAYANDLFQGRALNLDYPPNGGLSVEEAAVLQVVHNNTLLQAALRKVIASCPAETIFGLLNLLDGTSDPEHGDWGGVLLIDRPDEEEQRQFLHDAFFETYWDWRAKRRNKNWRLDNLPE